MSTGYLFDSFHCLIPDPGPRFVYVVLCDCVDADGQWTIDASELAERTAMGVSTVRRHLGWLQKNGYIAGKRECRSKGRLGRYTWTVRRLELSELRPTSTRRKREVQRDEETTPNAPVLNSSAGVNTTAQFERSPSPELSTHNFPQDTSPSKANAFERARATASIKLGDFQTIWSAYPCKRAENAAKGTFVKVVGSGDLPALDVLLACIRTYAQGNLKAGKPVREWLNLASFLRDERWKEWMPAPPPPDRGAETVDDAPRFEGWDEFRAAVARREGESWALSYLDPATWNGRQLVARSGIAFDRLQERIGPLLRAAGVDLARPGEHQDPAEGVASGAGDVGGGRDALPPAAADVDQAVA